MQDFSFEHEEDFARGELAEPLKLGKYQAHYEELFAEIIEDGVITPEERARLNRAADALGLDRAQLRGLEEALQAAYEARHRVRVREIGEETPPQSFMLAPEAVRDSRVGALEARVRELEAQVVDLSRQLEEARAQAATEANWTHLPAVEVGTIETRDELLERIRREPRDVPALHGLYRTYAASTDAEAWADRKWLVAQALVYLGAAERAEQESYERGLSHGLIKPASSLSAEAWQLLFHPDEELLTGEIFAVIVTAVLVGRVSTLRRDKALPQLDPAAKQDPKVSTLQAVRCFSWAGAVLGMAAPHLYADPEHPGLVEMVPALPPATRLGRRALSGRSPLELAFIAGRHLSWHRAEHFIRLLVPTIAELENFFLAALTVANPELPLGPDIRKRATPLARTIEPLLESAAIDRLRGHFLKFIEAGGRTNLHRWAAAAEHTSARAGLLLANDLTAAQAVFEIEDPATVREKMDDLLVFVTSDRYAKLRKQIGLSAAGSYP